MICEFHINKNVESRLSKTFNLVEERTTARNAWFQVMKAATEEDHITQWDAFKRQYSDIQYQQFIEYLRNTWLSRKEQFCKAWICRIRHYGVVTTSALEGLHASIKRWLHTSQNNLDALVRAITLAAQGQDNKIRTELATNGVNITSTLRSSIIKILPPSIHQFVSKKALQLIAKEYYKAVAKQGNDLASLPSCTGSFTQIYGLPCAHQMRQFLHVAKDWKIEPQSISDHWYIQRPFSASSFIQPIIDLPEP
jgi:hypothetical protein